MELQAPKPALERTRRTLFFPAAYLLSGGLGLLLVPKLALVLMLSNGSYGDILPRFAGVLTIGLGVLVVQIIRHRAVALYSTLIGVRVFFCACYALLGLQSHDPLFLTLLIMVGAGVVVSSLTWRSELRAG